MAFDKQIIQDAISEFMAEFAKDYTKAFAVAIVKQAIDGEEKHIEPDRRLRKFVPTAPVLQSVVMQSPDGGKKTKEAFWKINQQWNIEVWAKEADMTAGKKPKQTICPWDYSCWYWYPPTTFPRRRGGPKWEEGEDKPNCPGCEGNFTLLNRRAHCRTCGIVHCWNCTKKTWPLYTLGYTQPERVCTTCFKKLDTEGLDSFVFPPEDGKDDQFGVKLYHGYRNPVYFSVDSSELRSKWMDALYQCCRYAEAPRNPSLFQRAAFETAHRNAWYNKGPWWRWWKVFGTEEEMLSELLAFYVNRRCLTRVLESVKGPAAMRSKAEKPIEKAMAKMVEAAVSAGWPKTVEAVGKTESVVQPKVADALGPIGEAKGQLMDKLQEGIEQPIKSAIDAVGQPLLNAVVPIMFKPLIKALVGAPMILREAFKEVKTSNVSNYSDFQWRCRRTYFWWRVRDKITVPELEPMYDALRLLGKVPPFNFLNPWDIKYGISNACEELLDNFFYTLETEESVKAAIEGNVSVEAAMNDAWPALYDRFAYDAKKIAEETAMSILMKMLGFPIVKTVMEAPGVGSTLETLQNAIPGPLQEFFNIPECVEEVLTKAIAGVCSKIVDDNMKANFAHLEEGYTALSQQLA